MPYIMLSIAVIVLVLLVVFIYLFKTGKVKNNPDYRALFILGIVFIPIGITTGNHFFWVLGIIYAILGLVNKKKWNESRPKWTDLSPEQKKIKVIVMIALGALVLGGLLAFFLYSP